MTSNWRKQRILRDPQQSRKYSAWGAALGIALLGVLLSAQVYAATFTVNTATDIADANPGDGVCDSAPPTHTCTLRAAIQEANALPGADEIILSPNPNPYLLTILTELQITSSLTITGAGASTTIIDGNKSARPNGRVLVIGSGITVNISGVTIRNGGTGGGGGGIFNVGTLTLTNSTVSDNSADGTGGVGGGGISNAGRLTLINTTLTRNLATNIGGGIYNNGTLTLTNSTVFNNGTLGNGAAVGGGIFNAGTLTLINSSVTMNSAVLASGGGVYNASSGVLTVLNSTVRENGSSGFGGGAFYNDSGGSLTIANSTVSDNFTTFIGGGIHNVGTLTLSNSTISGNSAFNEGGGILNNGTARLFNSTIANNRSDDKFKPTGSPGAGVFNQTGATFNFQNTILANNQVGSNPNNIRDCAGTLTSQGYNLIRIPPPGECNVAPMTGDLFFSDPQLGPLQDNGGPTQTHALLAGSLAIDAGIPGGCRDQFSALLTTDQRGFPRPSDGNNDGLTRCDIGAFELFTGSNTSVVAALLPSSRSVQVGTPATAFATVINTGQGIAAGCSIAPLTNVPSSFVYQTTNPANQIIGLPNAVANIAAGAAQSFVFAITPTALIPPTDVQFSFDCANSDPAPINTGLNTLLLSASNTPVPDIVALAATTTNDGIVNIPGTNGTGAFAVATVNVGASASITASADTGSASLPVNISLCETNPATGQCLSGISSSVTTQINANATPTFGIFVQGNDNVPFDPAANRVFVRFKDGGAVTRGSTSVAVRTQ